MDLSGYRLKPRDFPGLHDGDDEQPWVLRFPFTGAANKRKHLHSAKKFGTEARPERKWTLLRAS